MLNQSVIDTFQPIQGVRIGIDKVALSIPLAKGGTHDYATKCHLGSEILNSEHHPKIKKTSKLGHSAVEGKYFDPTGQRKILTVVVGTVWGRPYCQFVFNPNRLVSTDWQTIEEILCTCFEQGLCHLLENGVIRKLELSLDLANTSMSKLVTIGSRIMSGATDYKGTQYLGKRNSRLSVATYDKSKQLADVEGIHIGHVLTRIEARLVLPTHTLLDVAEGQVTSPWGDIFRGVSQIIAEGVR